MGFWISDAGRQVFKTLKGVGVLAMLDAGLNTTRCVDCVREDPPGAGVLRLLVPGIAVGVFNDHRSVADWVEVMH